ncbi:hypothetical protein ES703_110686 [subsurface metagenome]
MRSGLYKSTILLVAINLLISCATPTETFVKPNLIVEGRRLGITPCHCETASVGNIVSDTIGANLFDTGFIIIERTYLSKILEEQGLNLSRGPESIDYQSIGKLSTVDYLLVGSVAAREKASFFAYGYMAGGSRRIKIFSATIRIIDVNTGEVLAITTFQKPQGEDSAVNVGKSLAQAIKMKLRGEN